MLLNDMLNNWDRTINNCKFYYDEDKPIALINEIGVLRGIFYSMEVIGMDTPEQLEELTYWIKYQESFKELEVKQCQK